jgi:hypothetical protein
LERKEGNVLTKYLVVRLVFVRNSCPVSAINALKSVIMMIAKDVRNSLNKFANVERIAEGYPVTRYTTLSISSFK